MKHRLLASSSRIVEELSRFFLMTVVLRIAANLLSRKNGLVIANWCGSAMLCIPSSRRPAMRSMKIAFGMDTQTAKLNAREYLSQPFRAYVIIHRVLHGRESIDDWKVRENDSEDAVEFRKSGQSFIIATGHFARHIAYAMYFPKITPGLLLASVGPTPKISLSPAVMRTRLQYKQYLAVIQHCRKDIDLLVAGSSRDGRALLTGLKRANVHAIITADAFWDDPDGGVRRPFLGQTCHNFATGAATLGRLAQCPVIPCAPYLDEQGTIVLQWGPTIHPPSRTDKTADQQNTNTIIDFLEKAIAQHPSQYVLPIGDERQWIPDRQTWEEREKADKKELHATGSLIPIGSSNISKKRAKGLRIEWPDRNTIEDALRELPENPDWPGIFQVLLEPRGPEKRAAVVFDREGPMGVVLLRSTGASRWELAANWIVPGFLFPVRDGCLYTVLEALRMRVDVGWWRFSCPPPSGPIVQQLNQRMRHQMDCRTNFDAYWKQSGHLHTVRQAQRRCKNFTLKINPEGGAEWTIRVWEQKWRTDPQSPQPGLEDRVAIAKFLESSGRHNTHVLYDGETPIVGLTHVIHKDCVVAQVIYRHPDYDAFKAGTYTYEAVFRWAAQSGYATIDIGGGFTYKDRWAPPAGSAEFTSEFTIEPIETNLMRKASHWFKRNVVLPPKHNAESLIR